MSRLAAFLVLFVPSAAFAQGGEDLAPPPTQSPNVVVDVEVAPDPDPAPPAAADEPSENAPPAGEVIYAQPAPVVQARPAPVAPVGAPVAPTGYGPQPAQPSATGYVPGQQYYPRQSRPRRVRIRYQEGMEIPEGAALVERRKRGLLIAGIAAFAASYGMSAVFASLDSDLAVMAVPFVGPVIWQVREGDSDTAAGMALLSVAQVAGVVLFALGFRKRSYIEYWAERDGPTLMVTPNISPEYAGVSLTLF